MFRFLRLFCAFAALSGATAQTVPTKKAIAPSIHAQVLGTWYSVADRNVAGSPNPERQVHSYEFKADGTLAERMWMGSLNRPGEPNSSRYKWTGPSSYNYVGYEWKVLKTSRDSLQLQNYMGDIETFTKTRPDADIARFSRKNSVLPRPQDMSVAAIGSSGSYSIALTEKGPVYTGQLMGEGQGRVLTDTELNDLLPVYVNRPGDLMTLTCRSGYKSTAASASYGIAVGHDPDGIQAQIRPGKQGTIKVTCTKK